MAVRSGHPIMLEFLDGAAFAVKHIDGMETRPADPLERAPKSFVWTGYRKIELSMPVSDFDKAHAIMVRSGLQPCVMVSPSGDERRAYTFAATSLQTSFYDAIKPQDMIRGELDGVLYEKAADGAPVTDPALVAYLIEQHKPKPMTPEEEAQLDADLAFYDGE
jgi:hypothetical protein